MQIEDINFFVKCMENVEEMGFVNKAKVLHKIMSTKNTEIIDYFIQNREKYDINTYFVGQLVSSTENPIYIKSFVENRGNYGFSNLDVLWMIVSIQDREFVNYFIENGEKYGLRRDYILKMAIETRDKEIEKIIENKDKEIIESCIKDKQKNNLNKYDIIDMIIATKDKRYIESYIEDADKNNFNIYDIIDMMVAIEDKDYIKNYIENKNNFKIEDIGIMTIATKDKNYIEKMFTEGKFGKFNFVRKLKFPKGMQFGVEIETEGDCSRYIKKLSKDIIADDWKCKEDLSLDAEGLEVVSPPLNNKQSALRDINKVCTILKGCGQTISERCAGHIHIDASYLTNIQSYRNLIEIWQNTEKIIYIIANEKGTVPRKEAIKYAPPISKNIEDDVNSEEINLQDEKDLQEFIESLQKTQRY